MKNQWRIVHGLMVYTGDVTLSLSNHEHEFVYYDLHKTDGTIYGTYEEKWIEENSRTPTKLDKILEGYDR
jgi:hypothetical protein